jgi:glutaredoxin
MHARLLRCFLHGVGVSLSVPRRDVRHHWKAYEPHRALAIALPSGLFGLLRGPRHDRVRRVERRAMSIPSVTLYTRVGCHLCDVARDVLEGVRRERPFDLTTIDVDSDAELAVRYGDQVPVVTIGGRKAFELRVDAEALRAHLDRAEVVARK